MLEFLKENAFVIVFAVMFLALFLWIVRLILRVKKTDREGMETDAVVCRVEFDRDEENGDSYVCYASYRDENGVERESFFGRFLEKRYEEGQRIRIKFLPGKYDLVRLVRQEPGVRL